MSQMVSNALTELIAKWTQSLENLGANVVYFYPNQAKMIPENVFYPMEKRALH